MGSADLGQADWEAILSGIFSQIANRQPLWSHVAIMGNAGRQKIVAIVGRVLLAQRLWESSAE